MTFKLSRDSPEETHGGGVNVKLITQVIKDLKTQVWFVNVSNLCQESKFSKTTPAESIV